MLLALGCSGWATECYKELEAELVIAWNIVSGKILESKVHLRGAKVCSF